jgi:amino acid adenylation domain-containing protein
MFMTLLAALNILLYRYTQQDDIVVGSPIASRNRVEIEGLIGCFANTLALRTDLSGNPSFLTLVQRVYEMALNAYTHQDIPFEKLVEELRPVRDQSYSPIFQVMFALQNTPSVEQRLADLQVQTEMVDSSTAKFDLTLSMRTVGNGLEGYFEYRTDLFAAKTIQRMIGHFETLLTAIVADPDAPIRQLPLLTATEQHQIFVEWDRPRTDYPQDQCIHQRFEAQVEQTPTAIAIQATDQTLTYAILEQRANQLAHYLQQRGIGPNQRVGICLERNSWLLVGLLGVLKTGAAYVPLDPSFPIDRLNMMVEDSQISLLISQSTIARSFGHNLPHLDLDLDWPKIANQATTSLTPILPLDPTAIAYVIYTSGSTGRPKGVEVTHRGVVNFLTAMQQTPGISAQDVLLSVTTLSFDIAVLELFLPLTVGAKVVIAERSMAIDGVQLRHLLEQSGATIMQATPATWRLLLAANWQGNPHLKLLCGGEALSLDIAKALTQRSGSLWNLYGPTETTIWSLLEEIPRDPMEITIGYPIANTQTYVVNEALQPVPIGIPGELLIGGDGVAQGYWQRPDLTTERFIANPFSAQPTTADRLYRTGDLVRYQADGRLEFLGRIDQQIKLRGFRIELGEIETLLIQHPSIKAAVVVVKSTEDGDCLVAYLIPAVTSMATNLDHVALRQFLRQKLPQYMLPTHLVMLDQFPLTPNGKIDHRALPQPSPADIQSVAIYVAPRNQLEQQLADIWAEVLKLAQIGIHDNFFEIGGHSLLVIKIVSQMERKMRQSIPVNQMFQTPTIASMAQTLTHRSIEPSSGCVVLLKPGRQDAPLFLVHAVGTSILFYQPLAQLLQSDRAIYVIQPALLHDPQLPIENLETLAQYYLQQIKQIQPQGPYYLGGASFGGCVVYEMAYQLEAAGEAVGRLILFDCSAPGGRQRRSGSSKYQAYWQTLREIGPRYIGTRIRHRLTYERWKFERRRLKAQIHVHAMIGHPIGTELQAEIIYQRHAALLDDYTTKPYNGNLVVIWAEGEKDGIDLVEPDLGWRKYVSGKIKTYPIPGGHMSIFEPPYVQALASCLDAILNLL